MKRTLFSLTMLVAILVASLAFANDEMAGELDYLPEAQKIVAEIKDQTFDTWDGITYFRGQMIMVQISDPQEHEITDVYVPELSKSGILNSKGFHYNFSLELEGIPILLLLSEIL